jgi:DtxR family Mn-dependent transcriptional regulator
MVSVDLSSSQEDYLEAIYHVVAAKLVARSKDLVLRLGVNSSSVTQALKVLSEKELINYEPYGVVTLTAEGEQRALEVIRRHQALRDFFVRILRVDEAVSEDAACRMEHDMPRVILDRLVSFIEFTDRCPNGAAAWDDDFGYFCRTKSEELCDSCELLNPIEPSQE